MNDRHRAILATLMTLAIAGCTQSGNPTALAMASAGESSSAAASSVAPTASPAPTESPSAPVELPHGSEPVTLDPALFAGVPIDHPFWPMTPGSEWVYHETDAEGTDQQVVVTVSDQTKEILGITATVVHDVVSADGETIEDTLDWYAQDAAGNLWYLGEDTKEYENGKVVTTEGSWEAGVDGAQPGIILPADPAVGTAYRQEYYAGQAEDEAEILSLDEHVDVPAGSYDSVLKTKDFTALDPDMIEQKFYARGVGPVQVIEVSGGSSQEELLSFKPG